MLSSASPSNLPRLSLRLVPPSQPRHHRDPILVLWDGECDFCRACVGLVERLDRRGRFRAIPYQEAPSPPMTPELIDACRRALHVRTPSGRLYRGGDAVIAITRGLGWRNAATFLALPGIRQLVHLGYRAVAANRPALTRLLIR